MTCAVYKYALTGEETVVTIPGGSYEVLSVGVQGGEPVAWIQVMPRCLGERRLKFRTVPTGRDFETTLATASVGTVVIPVSRDDAIAQMSQILFPNELVFHIFYEEMD
jgi:hypothetical protein